MIIHRPYQARVREKPANSRPLFSIFAFAVILLVCFMSGENCAHAQVRVTGHVFAEIVEPTALSAKASNMHVIEAADKVPDHELILAEVKISGTPNTYIDVYIQSEKLKAANGDILPLKAYSFPGDTAANQHSFTSDGLFTLKARPGKSIARKKNTIYNGRYRVVFTYN